MSDKVIGVGAILFMIGGLMVVSCYTEKEIDPVIARSCDIAISGILGNMIGDFVRRAKATKKELQDLKKK